MIKDFISENWWKITQNFSRQFLGQVLNVANIYSLRNLWNWWNFVKLLKFARQFLGSVLNVAYLLLGKVICLWHIINIPPKTTTCDKTKDSLRRLKVNFKKIFKLLLRILLHQTVQQELSNLDNRLQFSFRLGTSWIKLATCHHL